MNARMLGQKEIQTFIVICSFCLFLEKKRYKFTFVREKSGKIWKNLEKSRKFLKSYNTAFLAIKFDWDFLGLFGTFWDFFFIRAWPFFTPILITVRN